MRDKPIPSMPFRYYLEGDRSVEMVFAKAFIGAYGSYPYDELLKVARHRAYALETEHRVFALVERFKSLYFVDALLSFTEFPFLTPGGVLSREQWVRIACDVMLGPSDVDSRLHFPAGRGCVPVWDRTARRHAGSFDVARTARRATQHPEGSGGHRSVYA